jgi:hypothetical protein
MYREVPNVSLEGLKHHINVVRRGVLETREPARCGACSNVGAIPSPTDVIVETCLYAMNLCGSPTSTRWSCTGGVRSIDTNDTLFDALV